MTPQNLRAGVATIEGLNTEENAPWGEHLENPGCYRRWMLKKAHTLQESSPEKPHTGNPIQDRQVNVQRTSQLKAPVPAGHEEVFSTWCSCKVVRGPESKARDLSKWLCTLGTELEQGLFVPHHLHPLCVCMHARACARAHTHTHTHTDKSMKKKQACSCHRTRSLILLQYPSISLYWQSLVLLSVIREKCSIVAEKVMKGECAGEK